MTWSFAIAVFVGLPIVVASWIIVSAAKKKYKRAVSNLEEAEKSTDNSYRSFDSLRSRKIDAEETLVFAVIGRRVAVGFLLLLLLVSSVWFVPVRNVGLVLAFNAPTGRTTGSGLAVTWPWEEVADFDASVQVSDHTGVDRTAATHCTDVRIGSLATACVENKIQWQVLEAAAPDLYRDYKGDFNNLRNNLVETYIQNALNAVFSTYNPLSQVNIQTGQTEFDGAKLGDAVKAELNRTIGTDIKILTVSVPLVHHDTKTEENIKAFQDVIAQARILEQKDKNATLEKAVADKQRAFLTPEYIQNKCIEESVKMGVPPGLCLVDGAIVNTVKP